ncbi:DNA helicase [Clostridium botulinum]|uniref:DNA helicase n=2 Tax=Clostridium botulinum TaxID=1491 RepID=A0A0A0ILG6_CLOBO|nr:AAA domain-containing protein [Clostridium botulinum]KGN01763.1 DNA helicase [Clostridium botulinum C/D str. DC5]KOC54364.1 DNA helicase [Clostridium botulinum]KOC58345.1 DNA helicase [Clostridium botulinum]MCD3234980.1 DNA helicase [Clostridium botulinum D/C]MCD3240858.1 DNA helicase [Clostridium botulinum D/C]
MNTRERLKNIIYYLISVKNMNSKVTKNILEYKKVFWEKNLVTKGCILKIEKSGDRYIEINKKSGDIYNEFSKLYPKLLKEQDNIEIIWGYCFITLKIKNKKIAHPLFSYRCNLIFDELKEMYILKPINEFQMEIQILDHMKCNNLEKLLETKNYIEDSFKSINKLDDLNKVSKIFNDKLKIKIEKFRKINSNIINYNDINIENKIQIYNEPIIIIRNYHKNSWNKELNNMLKMINRNEYIPGSVKSLVDKNYISTEEDLKWQDIGKDILYSLPYNKEQRSIGESIAENFGVVVQGPPGTGKTYSIANLISHLLAHNKRILITSTKYKSLEPLINMIPKEIRSLCINYNENKLENLSQIYHSVIGVIEKIQLNSEKTIIEIKNIQRQLELCRKRKNVIYKKMEISNNLQEKEIHYLGRKYKIRHIEKWLEKYKSQYSWIEDDISSMKKPPVTDAKFSRLLYIMSNTTKDEISQLNDIGGLLYNIPPYYDLFGKIKRKFEIQRNYNEYKLAVKDWCISYNCHYDYEYILKLLKKTQRFLITLEDSWLQNILNCAKRGEIIKVVLQQAILKCNYYIKKLGSIKKEIYGQSVEIPKDMDLTILLEKLEIIYKQYEQKGKINKIFRLLHSDCEEVIKKCLINCKIMNGKESVKIAKLYVEQTIIEQDLINLWNDSMSEYGAENIQDINLEVITNLEEYINKIDIIINWDTKVVDKITNSMKEIVFLNNIDWYNEETYNKLQKGVMSIKYISEYEGIKSYIGNIEKLMSKVNGFNDIVQAIKENDIVSLKQCYKKIDRLKTIMPSITEMEYILEKIEKSCPKLIDKLMDEKDRVNMLIKYKNFSIAWFWRQLDYILKDEYNKFKLENINKEIEVEIQREQALIQKLSIKRCWHNTISKISEEEKRSLYSYKEAISRLGKASGKNSLNYLRLAQQELNNFKKFMPVWIMPLDEVIENLSLSEKLFDVVIMDDASDMNIFAISALFRAEKAIIFGDDNEINIENTIQNYKQVKSLAKKYLTDIPNWQWFDMKTSIYSTALRIFPLTVTLKENLRSLPEIINFSNELCYSNKIITHKDKKIFGELWSAINTVKVDGLRDKDKPINVNEAKAIVEQIEQCCKNPIYDGMSMGVISLLGDEQGELINNLLKNKMGDEEMKNRKIICGNPYTLQGEERDIIFLSMVISNNVKFATLTKDADIRRFNVATSRAKRQMWLFHSVNLEDLNEECVRAKLLNYCINFKVINKKLRIA